MWCSLGKKSFLLYLITLTLTTASAQTISIKHYTTNDGLPSNHIYTTHQDLNGYLWITSPNGLCRFDGKHFKSYTYTEGLVDNDVLLVTNDDENNIWTKSFTSTPVFSVIKEEKVFEYKDSTLLISPYHWKLTDHHYSAKNRRTYISGLNLMVLLKRGTKPIIKETPLIGENPFFETSDGKIFSGDGSNIYEIKDTTIELFQKLNLKKKYLKTSCFNDHLYLTSDSAVHEYVYKEHTFHYISSVNTNKKVKLVVSNKYGIWLVFTYLNGVYLYPNGDLKSPPININVHGVINHISNDTEGNVWLSTIDNGLFQLTNPDIINYTEQDGLSSSVAYTVEPISDSTFWVGYNTNTSELLTIKGTQLSKLKAVKLNNNYGFSDPNYMIDIKARDSNNIFLLSRSSLVQIKNNIQQEIPIAPQQPKKSISIINDSLIAVGEKSYTIYNLSSQITKSFNTGRVYTQIIDSNGVIWLGCINGLFTLFRNSLYQISTFKGRNIISLAYRKPYIWVGTKNNGIYLLKDTSVLRHYTKETFSQIPSNTIKTIAVNGDKLWIGTNKGILYAKYNYETLAFNDEILLNIYDGLISSDINKICVHDSTAFIATYKGISLLNIPQKKSINYKLSNVYVKASVDDSVSINRADVVNVKYSKEGFEIKFTAVAFKYNDEIHYKYKLDPFDKKWKSTSNNFVQYTNIPPGDYNFIITAHDNRGNSSTKKVKHISIAPLIWQTTQFKLLAIFILITLIAALSYLYFLYARNKLNKKIQHDKLIAATKLEAHKTQLKPHFIFNSLNAIQDYIFSNKNENAGMLLQNFSDLIRMGLNLADHNFITIKDEVTFLKKYLDLEKLKCEDCFEYSIFVDKNIEDINIPSLIILPFVENAIVHGVRSSKKASPKVQIAYKKVGNNIMCTIHDDGIGINNSYKRNKLHKPKGIQITKERIMYFNTGFGIEILLDISDKIKTEHDSGTEISITIINAINNLKHEY